MSNPTGTMRISFIEPTLITEAVGPVTTTPEYRYEFLFDGYRILNPVVNKADHVLDEEAVVIVKVGSTDVFVAIKIVGVRRG